MSLIKLTKRITNQAKSFAAIDLVAMTKHQHLKLLIASAEKGILHETKEETNGDTIVCSSIVVINPTVFRQIIELLEEDSRINPKVAMAVNILTGK